MLTTFAQLASLAEIAPHYLKLRQEHPTVPARTIYNYLQHSEGGGLEQFMCDHKWVYTGTAYGGDDERYMGEGRCYCAHCGADGDS